MKSIKPIKCWAVVKGGKLDAWEIYKDKDVELSSNERLIRVTITADEKNTAKTPQRNARRRVLQKVYKKRGRNVPR